MTDFFGIAFGAPAQSVLALVDGTAAAQPGRAIVISCTVAATITITLTDTTNFSVSVPVGVAQFNWAATKFHVTAGTATAALLY